MDSKFDVKDAQNSTELFPVFKLGFGNLERVLFQLYTLLLNKKRARRSVGGLWGLDSQYLESLKTAAFHKNNLTFFLDLQEII